MTALTAIAGAARLLLAIVFAVAGVAKLVDREGGRKAAIGFGVPARVAGLVAVILPLAELAVAVLLVPSSTAVAGSIGALVLLLLFSLAIARSLARGAAPDCHCFGQLHSAPAGRATLMRNCCLAALAALALVGSLSAPRESGVAWLVELDAVQGIALAGGVLAVVALSLGAVAFLSLIRSYGRVLVRLDRVETALAAAGIEIDDVTAPSEIGLAPGEPAPWFLANDSEGRGVSLDDLLSPGLPLLVLFTSPHCGPCAELLPRAREWQLEHRDALTIVFAADGDPAAVRAEAQEFELAHVLVDADRALSDSFQASGTPSAVLVGADGTIASWVAAGAAGIEALVEQSFMPPEEALGLPVGADVPELELPGLDGDVVPLASFRGKDALLLFWNPECGHCAGMRDDLLAWEEAANGVTPRLVIVSSGDADSTRADGFSSTVLLDEDFAAGDTFGAGGTPMAVLLGADGRVASEVVGGAEAVFELANAHAHGRRPSPSVRST